MERTDFEKLNVGDRFELDGYDYTIQGTEKSPVINGHRVTEAITLRSGQRIKSFDECVARMIKIETMIKQQCPHCHQMVDYYPATGSDGPDSGAKFALHTCITNTTPGPWKIKSSRANAYQIKAGKITVATIIGTSGEINEVKRKNAQAIAAVPTMIGALETLAAYVNDPELKKIARNALILAGVK